MATFKSEFALAQEEMSIKRNVSPSHRPVQQEKRTALLEYVVDGAEVATDDVELGAINLPGAVLIPEESRIHTQGGVVGTVKLQKVDADGNATDLTGAVAVNNNSVVFTRASAGVIPAELGDNETLRLRFTAVTTTTADATIKIEATYRAPQSL